MPAAGQAGDADGLFLALHGLYWLAVNLAEPGLAVVVDDLQWADAMSLRWLVYLAARVEGLPILVAAAVRAGEPAGEERLLAAFTGSERARTLRPAALSVAAVGSLVSRRLGAAAPAFVAACHRATAGNPFMVTELLEALAADGILPDEHGVRHVEHLGPSTVARAVFLRLARLPPGANRLAHAVAVLGLDAELRHAAVLAGLDERDAASAADALAAAALLRPGRPLEFVHPIVRTSVYDDLPAEERALAHRDAARLLATDGADNQRIAAHLRASRPSGDPQAVEVLLRSASSAAAQGASTAAISDLRRALDEPPEPAQRGEVLLALGRAERHASDPAGVDHLREAADVLPSDRERCLALRELSRGLVLAGRLREALEAAERAQRVLAGVESGIADEIEAEIIVYGLMGMLPGHSADERLRRLSPAALDDTAVGGRLLLAVLAFDAMRTARPWQEAAALAERALRAGAELEPVADSTPRFLAMLALIYCECFDQAQARCTAELARARARGSVSEFATTSMLLGNLAEQRGRLDEADSHAIALLGLEGFDNRLVSGWSLATHVTCLLEQGAPEEAAQALTTAGIDDVPPELLLHSLVLARARTKIARGQTRAGLDDVLAIGGLLQAAGQRNGAAVSWRHPAALAHLALDEGPQAETLASDELEAARSFGAPGALGSALRIAGIVRAGAAGMELLNQAVDVLARSQSELEHARALTDLGAAMRRTGRRIDARQPLQHGMELAAACGATGLAARARDELLAAGARPRRVARTGLQALTPSERRVAELAGQGLSNREIAHALFVTIKTVETHLSHIYAKLGITCREQLPTSVAGM